MMEYFFETIIIFGIFYAVLMVGVWIISKLTE
jgi:hypothetical protein